MASDLKPVTTSVNWTGINPVGVPSTLASDTSMGASLCAHVKSRPPRGSAAAMWLVIGSNSTVFELTAPANSIIDVDLDVVLNDGKGAQTVLAAVAGATAGVLYVRALNSNGSNNIPPLSYPTI